MAYSLLPHCSVSVVSFPTVQLQNPVLRDAFPNNNYKHTDNHNRQQAQNIPPSAHYQQAKTTSCAPTWGYVCVCVCTVLDHERRGSLPSMCNSFSHAFLLWEDSFMQGHQGCMTRPGATKLQSCIRIWLKDASATYLQRQPPEVPKIRK